MIRDAHQVSGSKVRVDAARGVGHDQRPGAEDPENARRKSGRRRIVTLVTVDAALQGEDGNPGELTEHEAPAVTRNRGSGEARERLERHRRRRRKLVRESSQAGAQDDCHRAARAQARANSVQPGTGRAYSASHGSSPDRLEGGGRGSVLFSGSMSFGELKTFLQQGGITMGIIVLGSLLALFIGIERILFLRGFSARSQDLHQAVIRAILRGDAAQAVHECDRAHIPTAALYRAALDRATRLDRLGDAVDRARREVIQALRAPLWVLGTLGAVMPFVGLFGTVWGILHSFRQMAIAGTGGFAVVASGISEALFNYFQARVSKEAFDLTLKADELVEAVEEKADVLRASSSAARPAGSETAAPASAERVGA